VGVCGTYGKHFAQRGFEFFLLPSIVHARTQVNVKPLGNPSYKVKYLDKK
jgi:hypothetical protein